MTDPKNLAQSRGLAAIGLRLSDWFEHWFPDAFALALVAVGVVFAASVAAGNSVLDTAHRFGSGFWDLITFTIQMSMIVVTGYAVATAPPVYAVIRRLAMFPSTGPGATAFVALFSMLSSLLSWSFSLIFSGLLARRSRTASKGRTIARSARRPISAWGACGPWGSRPPRRSSWPRRPRSRRGSRKSAV
jgi:short subunit fatty acids transporter